jgi:TonB family protein
LPINAVEKQLISGQREPPLPPDTKQVMFKQGITNPVIMVKLCINAGGTPTTVELKKSSGFADADNNVMSKVREWRFRPYTVNGNPVPVCTAIMFRYVIGG